MIYIHSSDEELLEILKRQKKSNSIDKFMKDENLFKYIICNVKRSPAE